MKIFRSMIAAAILPCCYGMAETKLKMQDLPENVQKTAKAQIGTATLVGISKEREKGMTVYEVESKLNGKTRDFNIDQKGNLLVVEEEVAVESIPAAARNAISKRVGNGKLTKVESVTQGQQVSYEASYVTKAGKKSEAGFNADGTSHK